MATTPNYGWVTPAPTDFVTDLPADFETFADAADATVKALNPGTTAGDIDYYTSGTAKARLGIGTAGQVLAVNSGATAPEWITPAVGGMTQISSTTLTGTAINLTSIPQTYKELVLFFQGFSFNGNDNFFIRLNNDSTSNIYTNGQHYVELTTYNTNSNRDSRLASWTAANTRSGDAFNTVILRIPNYTDTSSYKIVTSDARYISASTNNAITSSGFSSWASTAAITSVDIYPLGVNSFDAGTVKLYGVS